MSQEQVDIYRLYKYNITPDEYLRMVDEQRGRCAICHELPSKRALAVDHDHETNKVRGLLCIKCNTGLGLFNNNIRLLAQALVYLEDTREV